MKLLNAHRRAMDEFDARVHKIGTGQWDNPTPCTDWSVRDLLNHLVGEQLWAPWLLGGATVEQVGDRFDGDQLGDDPVAAWSRASAAARAAWDRPGATGGEVDVSAGRITAEEYGWQMTLDLAVHGWDLARAIGADEELDAGLVAALHTVFAPQVESMQGIGIFAPPQPIGPEAGEQSRLLAMLGRRP